MFEQSDKWRSKKKVLELIDEDPSLLTDPVLDSFKTANTYMGEYYEWSVIEQHILNENWIDAENALLAITTNNLPQDYLKTVYALFIFYKQGNSISASDKNELETIANTCPLEGGYAVYFARGMLELVFDEINNYDQVICEDLIERKKEDENINNNFSVKVVPNPSNGMAELIFPKQSIDKLVISDITGKIIFSQNVEENLDKVNLDLSNQENGIYFYTTHKNNSSVFTGRIVIVK